MPRNKQHLILKTDDIVPSLFKGTGRGNQIIPNIKNRFAHGRRLSDEIQLIKSRHPENTIYTIKFNGNTETGLFFENLNQPGSGMELLSIKEKDGKVISANVSVESGKAFNKLQKVAQKYSESVPGSKTLSYVGSIGSITDEIKISDLFMDDIRLLPEDNNKHWWELWINKKQENALEKFMQVANDCRLVFNQKYIDFPDRYVFICNASIIELNTFVTNYDVVVTEIHLAKKINPPIVGQPQEIQDEIVAELERKTTYPDDTNRVRMTILDEGLIVRHPLLDRLIVRNLKAVSTFANSPTNAHTTSMGSLVAFGDIAQAKTLQSITIPYKIESVQICDSSGTDRELWGTITELSVNKTNTDENIVNAYVMAASAENISEKFGAPTSWSAKIDDIVFKNSKLFAISVGNVDGLCKAEDYDEHQKNSCVEDPAQSWNSLSVGAYTNLADQKLCANSGFVPYAQAGDLSPYSRTSIKFEKQWPIKPEVVFEGGNKVIDKDSYVYDGDMFELVTCSSTINNPSFCGLNMTSAATGMAGQFIGNLFAKYPTYWPETIRGLIVNSAEWTETMLSTRLPENWNKEQLTNFIKMCGYGVPNLDQALYSGNNALTLIAEKEFQVYDYKRDANGIIPRLVKKNELKNDKVCQILMIPMPWPTDLFQSDELKDKKIKVKITLSYFVAPNPSSRGYSRKFAYQSHNLRFDLQMPTETETMFMNRINANIAEEDSEHKNASRTKDDRWVYGKKSPMRTAGSIHQDFLITNGSELADMKNIAIYSVGGWWRDSKKIRPEDTRTRFSLIVSIDAGDVDIDIYTPIENNIEVRNILEVLA